MKKFVLFLLSSVLFFSCDNESKERKKVLVKKPVHSQHKDMKEQEVEREIIDVNEEGFSADAVLKIDKEIPVMEIIVGTDWKQADIEKIKSLQMVDTLRIENMDAASLDLAFTKDMKTLKRVSLSKSKLSPALISSLKDSKITTLDISNCTIDNDSLSKLGSITSLKSIDAKNVENAAQIKATLKGISVQ